MFKLLQQYSRSEEGSVLIMVAVSAMMLIAAAGAAVDMARAQTAQAKLSSALDAAGLAAGAVAGTSTNPVTEASRYFNANFPSGYMGTGNVTLNTTCADMNGNTVTCTSPSMYTISLSASTTEATTFMQALNVTSVSVSAATQITRQTSGMELALVLDNTGSMAYSVDGGTWSSRHPTQHQPKIDALQCAVAGAEITHTAIGNISCSSEGLVTSGLLDILYGNNTTLTDLFVGVIPFSDMVNMNVTSSPGSSFVDDSFPGGKSLYQGTHGGCLDSRNPATASTSDSGITLPSGDTINLDIGDDPPSTSYFQALTASSSSECPPSSVQPMTTSKTTAAAAVAAMNANGSTLLDIGLAWGWRMLSPNWKGLWGSSPTFTYPNTTNTVSLPLPYNTANMLKVVVFMTDGMDNNGSSNDSSNRTGSSNYDNAYVLQSYEPSNTKLDQLTKDVCDAMKSKGIIIYVVAFGIQDTNNPPTNSDRSNMVLVDVPLLKYCATQNYTGDTSHFFLAPTNAELQTAFQQIGQQLANLRISQ